MKNKGRNSNIELLRILCMIFIILHHSVVHSSFSDIDNLNFNILYVLSTLGRVANNIFIIITGYYMVNKQVKVKSIMKIILETIFYSYTVLLVYLIVSPEKNIVLILTSIIPISSNSLWFVTAYLLLYITIPIINILIKNINKEQFSKILIFLIICFSILPTILLLSGYFSYYIWFVCLYLVGAYLKLYENKEILKNNNIILILSSITLALFVIFTRFYDIKIFDIYAVNNFVLFILAVCIFVSFIKKKEWYNIGINYIASSVLGIYLLHDNLIVRPFIWNKFNIGAVINKNYFWIYEISIIIFVFCAGFIIDKAREKLIEKPLFKYIDKKYANRENSKKIKGENNVKISIN